MIFDKWRLAACRVQAGYTQKEAAGAIGVTEQAVISWEKGKTSPKMEDAKKLSELYVIPMSFMDFTKEGNAKPLRERMPEVGGING